MCAALWNLLAIHYLTGTRTGNLKEVKIWKLGPVNKLLPAGKSGWLSFAYLQRRKRLVPFSVNQRPSDPYCNMKSGFRFSGFRVMTRNGSPVIN